MLTENKVRQQFAAIWRSVGSPIRKARRFLKLSQRTRALGKRLMDLGFASHAQGEHAKSRRFWSAAAGLMALSDSARQNARSALHGGKQRLGFDYAPQGLAVPSWERDGSDLPKSEPQEVNRPHVGQHGEVALP